MAEVLLARMTGIEGFERHVVVKRILAQTARDGRYVAMFLDEARLAASLHHHNIVQVIDVGEADGEYFFAMEYVHGRDLRDLLRHLARTEQLPPLEHAIAIATAVASALHHAHEMCGPDRKPLNLVHRDVSPANILVGYDGHVKVADFGIAKAIARRADTEVGALKGKIAYMAPEQCRGQPVDRRGDVFSLGIVLFELLVVRRLFRGDSDYDTMRAIVSGDVPKPSSLRRDLPAALDAILLRALATAPNDRYQTADELRVALEDLATIAGLRSSPSALGDYMVARFGLPPLPWLAEPLAEPLARLAPLPLQSELPPSSPLPPPTQTPTQPIEPPKPSSAPRIDWAPCTAPGGVVHEVPTVRMPSPHWPGEPSTPSVPAPEVPTPARWPTSSGAAIPRRRRAFALAGGAVVVAGIVAAIVIALGGGGVSEPARDAAATATTTPPPSPPPPVASSPPVAPPVAPPSPTPATLSSPAPTLPPSVTEVSPVSPTVSPSPPRRVAKPPPPKHVEAPARRPAKPAPIEAKPTQGSHPAQPDCDPPFYFEGSKKIFKPACV
jgi:serine/threonine-protein kinase